MKTLKQTLTTLLLLIATATSAQTIHIVYTTDVHGALFPHDYITGQEKNNSLAHVYSWLENLRDTAENTILLDGGDILQGTPVVYYYNYADTTSINIVPRVFNFMQYDAMTVGNHDIETGHNVYDKVRKQLVTTMLSANIIRTDNGEPYFEPYTIINRAGKRIAILGLTTPYIPHWLPEYFWKGMEFEDMITSARKWVKRIKETENPDAIVGLFHSGFDYRYANQNENTYKNENASLLVAQQVEGFDVILIGHDHKLYNENVTTPSGREIPILDCGTDARHLGHTTLTFDKEGKVKATTKLISLANTAPSKKYLNKFRAQMYAANAYSHKIVGKVTADIVANECLFGNSVFVDMVHISMLRHTGADISFSAPLQLNTIIKKGELSVGNMFSLYKYENTLNIIELTGKEVKEYLEYSYDLWIDNPTETGHLLKLDKRNRTVNKHYNFDSAAGITYTVNPFKKKGERIEISSMSDGTPFDTNKRYKVAINSYRCNGGGGHLEYGAGIPHDKIAERIIKTDTRDLRSIIMNDLSEMKKINIQPLNNWKYVPQEDVTPYIETDKKIFN
jgi:2',3'-cyclic-nucleotide 2'-phosphodiesterase/3'-nucleotidase